MKKDEFMKMYPEIKNPTQEQIERAIFAKCYLEATRKMTGTMISIFNQHETFVKDVLKPYVETETLVMGLDGAFRNKEEHSVYKEQELLFI